MNDDNQEFRSKYPHDYLDISLGSDKSDYKPIVGEVNYVTAKVPKRIEEGKKSLDLQNEEANFPMKRNNLNQN